MTLTGSVGSFAGGENVLFRLDSSTGTPLGGTVAGTATPPAAPVAVGGSCSGHRDDSERPGGARRRPLGLRRRRQLERRRRRRRRRPPPADRRPHRPRLVRAWDDRAVGLGRRRHLRRRLGDVPAVARRRREAGRPSPPRRARRTPPPSTRPASPTARTTFARSRPTPPGTPPRARSRAAWSTTRPRPGAVAERPERGPPRPARRSTSRATPPGASSSLTPCTDAGSGPASASFPGIGATGWTHAAETVSGASPYTSSLYSWSGGASTPPDQSISAADAAGNSSTSTLHFVSDTTAPGGGSVDASGLVGTGSRYSTSTTLSIALAKGADPAARAGASSGAQLLREQGTLSSSDGQADGAVRLHRPELRPRRNRPGRPRTPTTPPAGS